MLLFELLGRVLRRNVSVMNSPHYVERVIQDRVLFSDDERYRFWLATTEHFFQLLPTALAESGLTLELQGYSSSVAFRALSHYSVDGNSWFAKVHDRDGVSQWLMWFGYNSEDFRSIYADGAGYPSVFCLCDHPQGLFILISHLTMTDLATGLSW